MRNALLSALLFTLTACTFEGGKSGMIIRPKACPEAEQQCHTETLIIAIFPAAVQVCNCPGAVGYNADLGIRKLLGPTPDAITAEALDIYLSLSRGLANPMSDPRMVEQFKALPLSVKVQYLLDIFPTAHWEAIVRALDAAEL